MPLGRVGAGLTDQSSHGAETVVMLFHRERNVLTERNRVAIDGRDFTFRAGDDSEGKHRFVAVYSAGIQIVVFPFGQWSRVPALSDYGAFQQDEARLMGEDDTAGSSALSFDVEVRTGGVALVAATCRVIATA